MSGNTTWLTLAAQYDLDWPMIGWAYFPVVGWVKVDKLPEAFADGPYEHKSKCVPGLARRRNLTKAVEVLKNLGATAISLSDSTKPWQAIDISFSSLAKDNGPAVEALKACGYFNKGPWVYDLQGNRLGRGWDLITEPNAPGFHKALEVMKSSTL